MPYIVQKELEPAVVGPDGTYICIFDSLWHTAEAAELRAETIYAGTKQHAYVEPVEFSDVHPFKSLHDRMQSGGA